MRGLASEGVHLASLIDQGYQSNEITLINVLSQLLVRHVSTSRAAARLIESPGLPEKFPESPRLLMEAPEISFCRL